MTLIAARTATSAHHGDIAKGVDVAAVGGAPRPQRG